jgi:penicillin-binding protein 2
LFLKERSEDYPGISVEESWQRRYRYAPIASNVIGYVGSIPSDPTTKRTYLKKGYQLSDVVGVAGIEKQYEDELRGTPGVEKVEVDAQGRIVQVLSEIPPKPGNDVMLTIDLRVQQYAEQILQSGLENARTQTPKDEPTEHFSAPAGTVVVQDPTNGQVLAMASNPPFDNSWFTEPIPSTTYAKLFGAGAGNPLVNRAVQGVYAPASTFKPFTAVGALQSGVLSSPGATVDDTGVYHVQGSCIGKCEFSNARGEASGVVNLQQALTVSSDYFFYKLGDEAFAKGPVLQQWYAKFGFGTKTGIDLPSEASGFIPSKQTRDARHAKYPKLFSGGYYVGDNVQVAIGQVDTLVTPVQLANAYSAIANGGTLFKPTIAMLVLAPGTPDASSGVIDLTKAHAVETLAATPIGTVAIPAQYRDPILRGLEGVVGSNGGTAKDVFSDFNLNQFQVAGKTGTAQSGDKKSVEDSSLFASFGPVQPGKAAQLTVVAILEKAGFGAQSAAPVVKCMYQHLDGSQPMADPVQSPLLDRSNPQLVTLPRLTDTSCLKSGTVND